jgi:divalent metal cation (Fe/Co/Zn/Cd) transporter
MSETQRGGAPGQRAEDTRTRWTVFVALTANVVIAAAKAVGGTLAQSPALLSEAAHSVADTFNEIFLLISLQRGRRQPDEEHPFGYGKERFFWALLAAVGIFVVGGSFSFYQGITALRSASGISDTLTGYVAGLSVLGVALLAESGSLTRALVQLRGQARREGRPLIRQLRSGGDPALRTVIAEDSTACVGVLLAMRLGLDSTLVAARVDLVGGLDSEEVEEVSGRIRGALRERLPVADQIFLDITEASAEDRARAGRERRALDEAAPEPDT